MASCNWKGLYCLLNNLWIMGYDAIIAGASFAGLAVAHFIDGEVAVLEREEVLGARQRSTCAAPEGWVRRLGAPESVLGRFDRVVVHSPGGNQAELRLPEGYCTLDYAVFCRKAAERSGAEVLTGERVQEVRRGGRELVCTRRAYTSGVVVDASGWSAAVASRLRRGYAKGRLARGVEVEGRYEVEEAHIYLGSSAVPGGYAWVFPLGDGRARVGLGSLRRLPLVELNRRFLRRLGVRECSPHHGGVIPCSGLREPVVSQVFVVGDAAGQVLPGTAEGIRKCFEFAEVCGRLVSRVVAGELRLEEGLEEYRSRVLASKEFYETMLLAQRVAYRLPDRVLDAAVERGRELADAVVGSYFSERVDERLRKAAGSLRVLQAFLPGSRA